MKDTRAVDSGGGDEGGISCTLCWLRLPPVMRPAVTRAASSRCFQAGPRAGSASRPPCAIAMPCIQTETLLTTPPMLDTNCTTLFLMPTVTGNTVRSFHYARTTVRSPRKLNHCLTL